MRGGFSFNVQTQQVPRPPRDPRTLEDAQGIVPMDRVRGNQELANMLNFRLTRLPKPVMIGWVGGWVGRVGARWCVV